MKKALIIIFGLILLSACALQQTPEASYTLFTPISGTDTYLINEAGEIVYTWESEYKPGQSVYLLENGNLLRTIKVYQDEGFPNGGAGGGVQEIAPDGEVVWEFIYSDETNLQHHDVEAMPNGNNLLVAWERKTKQEVIDAGRTSSTELFVDHVIEVNHDGEIVWEWHVWDHLDQIDINYGSHTDFNHINSIDYNEELDQILLSVHTFNEIWIIDHSTGDLLYRWGNPAAYGEGNLSDMQLYGQHDAQWIEAGRPGEGNIIIFNNGRTYSSIVEITPDGSEEPVWTYVAENPTDFYGTHISGVERLANGNTLICEGPSGFFFEVTEEGEIVWEYQNELPLSQKNSVFKVRRYTGDYPGLKVINPST